MFSTALAAIAEKFGLGFSISVDILPSHFAPPSCTLNPGPQGLDSGLASVPTCDDLGIFLNRRMHVNKIICGQLS